MMAQAQDVLPRPETTLQGYIGRKAKDSIKAFSQEVTAQKGAPNILLILTDDVGYRRLEHFWWADPRRPWNRLGRTDFATITSIPQALSSPLEQRCCLGVTTIRHPPASSWRWARIPGLHSLMPKAAARLRGAQTERLEYTAWYGKNHNVPIGTVVRPVPLTWANRTRVRVLLSASSRRCQPVAPALVENIKPIEPPHDAKDYHLDKDLAAACTERIRMLHSVRQQTLAAVLCARAQPMRRITHPRSGLTNSRASSTRVGQGARRNVGTTETSWASYPERRNSQNAPKAFRLGQLGLPTRRRFLHIWMEVYARAGTRRLPDGGASSTPSKEMAENWTDTLVIYHPGRQGASPEGSPQGFSRVDFLHGVPILQ